jgi:hypothetical protein
MGKILIKESDFIKLIETAMDLDIYIQPTSINTDNGNLDTDDAIEDIIDRLKELLNMLQSGKKVSTELKSGIYKNLDSINKTYSDIKYDV